MFESSALKEVIGQVAEVVSGAFEVDKEAAAALEKERQTFVESKLKQAESAKGRSLSPTSRGRAEALFNEQFYRYAEYRGQLPVYGAFIPGLEAADGCARGTKTTGQAVGETAAETTFVLVGGKLVQKVWQGGKWVMQKGVQAAERRAATKLAHAGKQVRVEGKDSAKNVATHERYKEQLRVEQRTGEHNQNAERLQQELMSKGGDRIAGPKTEKIVKDEPRLISRYGGQPGDWAKIKGQNYRLETGETLEIHAYQNVTTGQIVEPKIKTQ